MEVESNQYTVNSTIPIIDDLQTNRNQKKGWRPKHLGIKKGPENYYSSLAKDYSQMRAAISLRGDTAKILKDTGVTMARLAEAGVVRPNHARKTYKKLYNWEAYNEKSRAALENNHAVKSNATKDNREEYRPGKKNMKGDSAITNRSLTASVFNL